MLDPRTVGLRGAFNSLNRRRLHLGPETLADRVFAPSLLMDFVLVLCGMAIVSLAAQFVVALWPVPSTGQIIGVLLVGYCLGALRAGLALTLYLVLGGVGVPVFNNGGAGWQHLSGDTGGYLVGFVVAAILAGLCAARGWDRRFIPNFVCSWMITLVVYAFGVARLMNVRGYDLVSALNDGFLPLVLAAVVKVLAVAIVVPLAWRLDEGLPTPRSSQQSTIV
ncbi:biotin transporter BioY [Salinibacterium sp. dk2585]|uniref:biotin transporter BioY n=1 Tax=unclassified Salinibacterium TaxID=2632331 RepID=UPI0011C24359|nr:MULTISPECIES: biotin transporter BioY [unclassified Salinibacterium]QEE61216.1 biotin transporter BioY [Salinibacterium sp. dk2585]TXK53891.1 biotin transporter BioY [Salinibacterium sp. dk5596]